MPEELIGRHLKLKDLPEFTIVGITDKKSPCIYADRSMFIDMLANNGSEEDYYGEGEEAGGEEASFDEEGSPSASAPKAADLMDYGLSADKLVLTGDSRRPENDYEVIVDSMYAKSMKLGSELKTKVNGHKLKVVGHYTSDSVRGKFFVNNNTIKYRLIKEQGSMTVKPAVSKAETIGALRGYGLKVRDLYEYQKKEYRKSQLEMMRTFLIAGAIVIIISLIEVYLIMRASFLSRIKEVGTLRAIGVKKSDIYKMFAGEIVAITVLASLPGWVLMNYIVYKLQGVKYLSGMFVSNPQTVLVSLLIIFVFNLVFGLLPVFRTLIKRPAAILARTDVN